MRIADDLITKNTKNHKGHKDSFVNRRGAETLRFSETLGFGLWALDFGLTSRDLEPVAEAWLGGYVLRIGGVFL